MIELIQQWASELIAFLALIVAVASNWRAVKQDRRAAKSERRLESLEKAGRQTEYLVELERKNSAVAQVALVIAQKLLLLRENPDVAVRHPGEQERLENNLDLMKQFRDGEKEERNLAEHPSIGSDTTLYHESLMNTRRLRVRLESEVEKEREVYRELVQSIISKSV